MKDQRADSTVLFDGICNFCNASVNFFINRDSVSKFRFAALQSPSGQRLLRELGLKTEDFDTIVLVEEGVRYYTKSTAILRIFKGLNWPWPALYSLIALPRPIRDFFYRFFAKNRYRWFGRTDVCRVPTADLRMRFLE